MNEVYLRVKYIHTYSSGSITGINIGAGGLNFTASSSVKLWEKANDITRIRSWPEN